MLTIRFSFSMHKYIKTMFLSKSHCFKKAIYNFIVCLFIFMFKISATILLNKFKNRIKSVLFPESKKIKFCCCENFQKFGFKFKLGNNRLYFKNNESPVRLFNLYLIRYSKISLKNTCTNGYLLLFLLISFKYTSFISNSILNAFTQ